MPKDENNLCRAKGWAPDEDPKHWDPWTCTRKRGHKGKHKAHNLTPGADPYFVWPPSFGFKCPECGKKQS